MTVFSGFGVSPLFYVLSGLFRTSHTVVPYIKAGKIWLTHAVCVYVLSGLCWHASSLVSAEAYLARPLTARPCRRLERERKKLTHHATG